MKTKLLKVLSITLMFFIIFSIFNVRVYAMVDAVESPDIKIVINGTTGKYTDVPIIFDGRTLLPLRQVLTNLGVENDDEHIIWNAKERSVTVKKDSRTIYLKIGSKEAFVDGRLIKLDVPPMIYPKNNRTYIPVRFVAESLGKKVSWDADTRLVTIKERQGDEIS